MTVGLSAVNVANAWLNVLRGNSAGVTFTAPAVQAAKLHTGDPGSAGASNAAAGSTARVAFGLAAAAAGVIALTGTAPSWTNGGTSETISHISVWDATSSGNFDYSAALATPQAWATGNVFNLTSLSITLTPIAA